MTFKVIATGEHPMLPLKEEAFKQIGAEFVKIICHTEDEVIAASHDADAAVALTEPYTGKVMQNLNKCRLIVTPKVGVENIDCVAAAEQGILVANAGDYSKEEVSDHAMALLLACARKLHQLDKAAREGKWKGLMAAEIRQIWAPMFRLSGQTLGLLGFGRIARAMMLKAKGFGLKVIAYDPYVPSKLAEELGVELVDMERLLSQSDYISIHTTLTRENYHLLGAEQFKKMKPTAYIINTARGELVDEQALYVALLRGEVAGAGLDVLETEYISLNNPLFTLDNVIITCHSAHYSDYALSRLPQLPVEEVARVMRDEWPRALVNPEAKAKYQQKWGKS